MSEALLFVYGTLRAGFAGPMAQRLRRDARLLGRARTAGLLYRIADYPGLVPGGAAWVIGDLFALPDPATTLDWIDIYEECAPGFPEPWEYRRSRIMVDGPGGPACAWAYLYARDAAGLTPIASGDFLAP